MRIANRRRFGAFLAVVAAAVLAGAGLWFFRPMPLLDHLSRAVDIEQVKQIELTAVTGVGESESVTLTDPIDIRACLAILDEARVRRQIRPDTARNIAPGHSFLLCLTDASAREAILDVAGRSIVFNLNTRYHLVEPESLSSLQALVSPPAA